MKKKKLIVLCVLIMTLALSCSLIACTHTHEFGNYVSDEDYHWYQCKFCDKINDKKEHNYENFKCKCGKLNPSHQHYYAENGLCACGKFDPNHVHEFEIIQEKDFHYKQCKCGKTTTKGKHISSDNLFIDEQFHWLKCKVCNIDFQKDWHTFIDNKCSECEYFDVGLGLTYTLNEDGQSYTVTGIVRNEPIIDVVIPETFNDKPVTGIDKSAFKDYFVNESLINLSFYKDFIQSVTIPKTIKTIDDGTFINCKNLQTVKLAEGIEKIGISAFRNCHNLKQINFPSTLKIVDNYAFESCDKIVIKGGLANIEEIGRSAFSKSNITVANLLKVKNIGSDAFLKCENLTQLVINDNVENIEKSAFAQCNIEYLTAPAIITNIECGFPNVKKVVITCGTSIGQSAYSNCNMLYEITLPDTLLEIKEGAFKGCTRLSEITLPDSVEVIERDAFSNCLSLENLILPENLITYYGLRNGSVGSASFINSPKLQFNEFNGLKYLGTRNNPYFMLTDVTNEFAGITHDIQCVLHDDTKLVAGFALYNRSRICSLTLPIGLRSVGESAFENLINLESLVIPESVIYIGDEAFANCSGLKKYIISSNVVYIGKNAFPHNSATEIVVQDGHPYYYNVNGGIVEKETGRLFFASNNFKFPDDGSIKIIGERAFASSSFDELIIPEGVVTIENSAFIWSTIKNLVLPNSLVNIESSAFSQCRNLQEVVIPEGVKRIENSAFDMCSKLKSVSLPSSIEYLASNVFVYNYNLINLSIADGNLKYYSKDNCLIEKDSKTLFMGCTGSVIPNDGSVTKIGIYAFEFCTGLKSIVLPDTIDEIERNAFYGCSNLTEITLPSNLKIIGNFAFKGCSKLENIILPNSLISIGRSAFEECQMLKNIEIPQNVQGILYLAFARCNSLNEVTLSASTQLEELVFYLSNITTINFIGSKEEWIETIVNADNDIGLTNYVVHCNDGDIVYGDNIN